MIDRVLLGDPPPHSTCIAETKKTTPGGSPTQKAADALRWSGRPAVAAFLGFGWRDVAAMGSKCDRACRCHAQPSLRSGGSHREVL